MVSASGDHRVQALVHLGLLRSGVLLEVPDGIDHARGCLAHIHVPISGRTSGRSIAHKQSAPSELELHPLVFSPPLFDRSGSVVCYVNSAQPPFFLEYCL